MFLIIFGILKSFFADELIIEIEKYHAKRKSGEIANAPLNKQELIDSFK